MELVLASKSPRRSDILKNAGFEFTVLPTEFDESGVKADTPEALVESLSVGKAEECFSSLSDPQGKVVLAADTVVVLDGEVLGKPRDAADAKTMLQKLSGKSHTVMTAVTILSEGDRISFTEKTEVVFFPLTDEEIDDYIATKEPLDKAGAYGIQGLGCALVRKIDGDYFNVVGLPIAQVMRYLKTLGVIPHKGDF